MARWRAIHPKICQSLDVEQMSEWAQLLWDRIIASGDDWGRMRGEAALVKALCKPLSPRPVEDFEAALREMEAAGLVARYLVGRQTFLQIGQWERYQGAAGIHKRTVSDFPAPDDGTPYVPSDSEHSGNSPGNSGTLPAHSTRPDRTLPGVPGAIAPSTPSSPGGDADKRDGSADEPARPEFDDWLDTFNGFTLAKEMRRRPWPPTDKLRARFRTRRSRWSYDELVMAAMNLHDDAYMCGDNPGGKVYATPEYILRNDENVSKYQEPPKTRATGPPPARSVTLRIAGGDGW